MGRYIAASMIALATAVGVVAGLYFTQDPNCLYGLFGLVPAMFVAEPDLWPW